MFVMNKKTGMVQECHNNDAIKACMKDTEHYAVAERREDMEKESGERAAEKPGKKTKSGKTDNKPDAKRTAHDDGQGAEDAAGADQKPEDGVTPDEESLNAMTEDELRTVAKDKGIQGYANMNRETLIAMILNH